MVALSLLLTESDTENTDVMADVDIVRSSGNVGEEVEIGERDREKDISG
jgi:hypothetical protein